MPVSSMPSTFSLQLDAPSRFFRRAFADSTYAVCEGVPAHYLILQKRDERGRLG